MEISAVKSFSALVLLLVTFFVSMSPLFIFRRSLSLYDPRDIHDRRKRILSLLSCFAGGVFLGTCLLHLFPDVREQVDRLVITQHLNPQYPITEFLVSFGFLTILIVEQIGKSFQEYGSSEERRPLLERGNSPVNRSRTQSQTFEDSTENDPYVTVSFGAIQGQNEPSEYNISFPQEQNSIFHELLLLFALSLHSIFEGLAIGLQTTIRDDLKILVAVLIHKCVIAFSLGLKLTHSQMGLFGVVKSNVFFSLTSPVGILIGLAVMNLVTGTSLLVTSSILQGLASGTFLYITLFEVLIKEFSSEWDPDRMLKVLLVLIGFCVVSVLVIALPD